MAEVLNVEAREETGTSRSRRLRQAGHIPAILYGQDKPNRCLSASAEEVAAALRHGAKLVQLQGAVSETALIREVQWNPFGVEVLHLDLTRVSAGEEVEVSIRVELRGEAPGVKSGGHLEHTVHELTVRCPADAIPERLEININHLELNQQVTVGDLQLPEKVAVDEDVELVVVQCVAAAEVEEELEGEAPAAEPEVIGRKSEEGEEEG